MANLALNKLPLEESWINPQEATNGKITGYDGGRGFAYSNWPSTYTLDLGAVHQIVIIRFLLWDHLGGPSVKPDNREYKYSLSTSLDFQKWEQHYETSYRGFSGWQLFAFRKPQEVRYVRLNCWHNSENNEFHIVEFEVHDNPTMPSIGPAEVRNSQTILPPPVSQDQLEAEVGKQVENKITFYTDEISKALKKTRDDSDSISKIKTDLLEKSEELSSVTRQLNLVGKSLFFEQEAQKNKSRARWWFSGICVSFSAFIAIILCFLFGNHYHFIEISTAIRNPDNKVSPLENQTFLFESISYLAAKILFVSLLIYAVVFCVRNHRVQKHNYTINQHKAMSLFSASKFLNNNDLDKETRETILLQATNAIFSHQNSGFSDSSSDEKPSLVSNIIEGAKLAKK